MNVAKWIATLFSSLVFCMAAQNGFSQKMDPSVRKYITDSAKLIAFVDATVIDGTGNPSRSHQTIIIDNGIISQFGKTGVIKIPRSSGYQDPFFQMNPTLPILSKHSQLQL
jgi:hypothetical protein